MLFGLFKKKNDVVIVSTDTPKETKRQKPKKFKLDEDYEDFSAVDRFDTNEYINETFQDIFHSIMNDGDWVSVINNVEIHYKKKHIDIKIDYEDFRNFKIKKIILYVNKNSYSSSEIFLYNETLDENFYKFIHDFYSSSREEENRKKKEKCDDILMVVKDTIGKSSIRDRRLDELLGSN
jgi:hypothetical protein